MASNYQAKGGDTCEQICANTPTVSVQCKARTSNSNIKDEETDSERPGVSENEQNMAAETSANQAPEGNVGPENSADGSSGQEPEIPDDGVPYDRGWAWMIVVGGFVNFVVQAGYNRAMFMFFVRFLEEFGAPVTETALLFGVKAGINSIVGLFVMNVVLGKFGIRKTVFVGAICLALSAILGSFARSITALIFAQAVFHGLAISMLSMPGTVLIGYYFKKRRALANSITKCGVGVGAVAFPPMTSFFLEQYGLRGALLLTGGICLNSLWATALFRPTSFYKKRRERKLKRSSNDEGSHNAGDSGDALSTLSAENALLGNAEGRGDSGSNNVKRLSNAESARNAEDAGLRDADESWHNNDDSAHPSSKNADGTHSKDDDHGEAATETTQLLCNTAEQSEVQNSSGNGGRHTADVHVQNPKHIQNPLTDSPDQNQTPQTNSEDKNQTSQSHSQDHSGLGNSSEESDRILNGSTGDDVTVANGEIIGDRNDRTTLPPCTEDSVRRRATPNLDHAPGDSRRQQENGDAIVVVDTQLESTEPEKDEKRTCPSRAWRVLKRVVCVLDFSLFRSPMFRLLSVFFITSPIAHSFPTYLPAMVVERGVSEEQAALLLSIIGGLDFLSRILSGVVSDMKLLKASTMIWMSYFVPAVLCLLIQFMNTFPLLVVMSVVYGLMAGVAPCMLPILIMEDIGLDNTAKAFGFMKLFNGSAMAAFHPLIGFIRDSTGSYDAAYIAMGTFSLASAVIVFCLRFVKHVMHDRREETVPEQEELAPLNNGRAQH